MNQDEQIKKMLLLDLPKELLVSMVFSSSLLLELKWEGWILVCLSI